MQSLGRVLRIFLVVVAILLVAILRIWYTLSNRDFATWFVVILIALVILGVMKLAMMDSPSASETPPPDWHSSNSPKQPVQPAKPVSLPQPSVQTGSRPGTRLQAGSTPQLPTSTFYSLKKPRSPGTRGGTFVVTHNGRSYTSLESMPIDVLQMQLESMEIFSKVAPENLVMELTVLGRHHLAAEFDGHIQAHKAGIISKDELDARMCQILAKLKASVLGGPAAVTPKTPLLLSFNHNGVAYNDRESLPRHLFSSYVQELIRVFKRDPNELEDLLTQHGYKALAHELAEARRMRALNLIGDIELDDTAKQILMKLDDA